MRDLSSSTRAGTCAPVLGVWGLTLDHQGSPSPFMIFDICLLSRLLLPGISPFLLSDEKTGGDPRAPARDSDCRAHLGVTRVSGTGGGKLN